MNFVNNWQRPIVLAIDTSSAALDLPNGQYTLTVTDSLSAPTRWEIVTAIVAAGEATIYRGAESTPPQAWPVGSVIYCAVTAGALNLLAQQHAAFAASADASLSALNAGVAALQQRVSALESPGAFFVQASTADEWVGYSLQGGVGSISAGASVYPGVTVQGGALGEVVDIFWAGGNPLYGGIQLQFRCAANEFQTVASLPFTTLKIGTLVLNKSALVAAGYGAYGQVFNWFDISVSPFIDGHNVLTFIA